MSEPTAPRGICAADDRAIHRAAAMLRAGELVAFPTETVYGLGANALNTEAVANIFEAKGRPRFDPLIVHVADASAARQLVAHWPPHAQQLADAFWPGPLTLVLPKRFQKTPPDNASQSSTFRYPPQGRPSESSQPPSAAPVIPDLVTAGLPTVAIRVPDHPVALALIRAANLPVAAPSANRFGGVSPTSAEHVRQELGDSVSLILDGGPCRTGVESTVLSLLTDVPTLLRPGGVPFEALQKLLGKVQLAQPRHPQSDDADAGRLSPGMLDRHYAPRTPLLFCTHADDVALAADAHRRRGLLILRQSDLHPAQIEPFAVVEELSARGDLHEAAANLFAAVRRLDRAGLDLILAVAAPEQGLGRAINDRLRRAAAPNATGAGDGI
jgi:L-threonylcarbamoyladenylate synthase